MTPAESNLTEFPCPVCGAVDYQELYPDKLGNGLPKFGYDFSPRHSDHYRVVRCAHCQHAYCSPRPANLYRSYLDVQDAEYLRNEAQRVATYEKTIDTIRRFKPQGKLLDVGCASGDFLAVARRNYGVEGLELSRWAAALARERGYAVHACRLSELLQSTLYDVVTMWGVIEHFEFPRHELAEIRRLLTPHGLVCLWTGDIDSLPSRLLGSKWWYVQGQHIQFFSLRSLDGLFASAGFFVLVMLGTLLAGRRVDQPAIAWAEALDEPEGGARPGVWDRLGLWFVVAVVLVLIAYAIPLWDLLHLPRYGSPGFKPF